MRQGPVVESTLPLVPLSSVKSENNKSQVKIFTPRFRRFRGYVGSANSNFEKQTQKWNVVMGIRFKLRFLFFINGLM